MCRRKCFELADQKAFACATLIAIKTPFKCPIIETFSDIYGPGLMSIPIVRDTLTRFACATAESALAKKAAACESGFFHQICDQSCGKGYNFDQVYHYFDQILENIDNQNLDTQVLTNRIETLENELSDFKAQSKAEIEALKAQSKADIEALKAENAKELAALKSELISSWNSR